jgi:hypothetical protein
LCGHDVFTDSSVFLSLLQERSGRASRIFRRHPRPRLLTHINLNTRIRSSTFPPVLLDHPSPLLSITTLADAGGGEADREDADIRTLQLSLSRCIPLVLCCHSPHLHDRPSPPPTIPPVCAPLFVCLCVSVCFPPHDGLSRVCGKEERLRLSCAGQTVSCSSNVSSLSWRIAQRRRQLARVSPAPLLFGLFPRELTKRAATCTL